MSNELPIACDLSAIGDGELNQHKTNGEKIFNSVQDWKELPDGYALKLPAETVIIEKAGSFIARERLCCPFFNFELEAEPGHGPVWLKITGSRRIKEFVKKNIVAVLEGDFQKCQC